MRTAHTQLGRDVKALLSLPSTNFSPK